MTGPRGRETGAVSLDEGDEKVQFIGAANRPAAVLWTHGADAATLPETLPLPNLLTSPP